MQISLLYIVCLMSDVNQTNNNYSEMLKQPCWIKVLDLSNKFGSYNTSYRHTTFMQPITCN